MVIKSVYLYLLIWLINNNISIHLCQSVYSKKSFKISIILLFTSLKSTIDF
jgi:hypothetical protein